MLHPSFWSNIMGTPLRISEQLIREAKKAAHLQERSVTAQIEHWAKLGMAVEMAVSLNATTALKATGGNLQSLVPDASMRSKLKAALLKIVQSPERGSADEIVRRAGRAIYEADRSDPNLVVRIDPDGTRTRGRMQGKRFVPARGIKSAA
jgi:hypothetical protein